MLSSLATISRLQEQSFFLTVSKSLQENTEYWNAEKAEKANFTCSYQFRRFKKTTTRGDFFLEGFYFLFFF